MVDGSHHRSEALFWGGSICGSLLVMVLAIFSGRSVQGLSMERAFAYIFCIAPLHRAIASPRPVFTAGNGARDRVSRSHSGDVKASFLLNLPFIFLPIAYCARVRTEQPPQTRRGAGGAARAGQ